MADPEERLQSGKRRTYFWLGLAALLFAIMFYFFYEYPLRSIGPVQPIYFSHRVHAGVKEINCRFCHSFVDRSANAGIPTLSKCFYCHKYIIPQHPQIVKAREHYDTKTPIPWVRIYYIPDFVFFDHSPHINWGRIDCVECHGDVRRLDRLIPVKFKMGFCIRCHRKQNAQLDCWLACHR